MPLLFLAVLFNTNLWIEKIILNNEGNSVILGPVYIIWGIYLAIIYNYGLFILAKKLIISKGFDRVQIKYILIAGILPMIVGIVPNIIIPLFGNYRYIFIGPFASIVMALIITYAILKHRLMDIRFVIARSVSYTLLLILIGIFYAGGLFAVSILWTKEVTTVSGLFFSTLLAVIISFSFQPLRLFLEKITDEVFYKGHYDSQELLHSFSQIMATTLTLKDLTNKLTDAINTQMRTSRGLFIIENLDQESKIDITKEQIRQLQSNDTIIVFEEIPEGEIKELMRKNEISLIFPLSTKEKHIGLLILGEKMSGEIFFEQDIRVLEIAGPEFAIALQNAQRFEEISQFNVKLQEEIKKATEDLKNANEELKKLDQLKDEFLSLAAHELRTPMTAIKGYSYELMKNLANPKGKEYVERIYKSTERLVNLVNDMLDVGRIESGTIEIVVEKIDLGKIITDVITEAAGKVAEKDLKLTFTPIGQKTFTVSADSAKLIQVLTNLIGNAVKFTPNGGNVGVAIQLKNGFVETTITDTGVGIDKEDLTKLFGKFVRAKTGSGIQGTGLGLYLSKKLINLMGGEMWVKSEGAGQGSIFGFTLKTI